MNDFSPTSPATEPLRYPGPQIRPQDEIRVVELETAPDEGQICCRTSVHNLYDNVAKYTALSYTWGSWDNSRTITLDGHSLHITQNLWIALRRLSAISSTCRLWIDQICINQHDSDERAYQVQLMAHIFQTITNSGHHPLRSQLEAAVSSTSPMWWTRAWVVQEFAMAQGSPIICFGPHQIEWDIDQIPFKLTSETADRWLRDMAAVRQDREVGLTLAQLGRVLARMASSDPRDKVYSMLGLVGEGKYIHVDYNASVSEAFIIATLTAVRLHGYGILSLSRPTFRSVAELPSWAVDYTFPHRRASDGHIEHWNTRAIHNFQDLFSRSDTDLRTTSPPAAGSVQASVRLVVLGSAWDWVMAVVPLGRAKRPLKQKSWRESLDKYTESSDERQFRAHCRHVMALSDNAKDPYRYATQGLRDRQPDTPFTLNTTKLNFWFALHLFNLWLAKWPTQARSSLAGDRIEIQRWTWYAEYQSNDMTFFITARGFLGFGPSTVRAGDTICLANDYSKLMMLRPAESGQWHFVSFAYVNGMTTAEQRRHATVISAEQQEIVLV